MPALLLLADHTGRLGNRLVLFSHVMAAAEEYRCRVINLSLASASHFFEGLFRNPVGMYPPPRLRLPLGWFFRCLRRPIQAWIRSRKRKAGTASTRRTRWLTVLDVSHPPACRLDSPEFKNLIKESLIVILWGYWFRSPVLVKKHQGQIRRFFRFRKASAVRSTQWLNISRSAGKKVLCVHVRLDDAKGHPELFMEPEYYSQAVNSFFQKENRENWDVVVCSDEALDTHLFPGCFLATQPRSLVDDFAFMAGCDALIGYASSLSIFSCFISKKPFYRVKREAPFFTERTEAFFEIA